MTDQARGDPGQTAAPPAPVYAIHGVDGTGKTTQARLLALHLRSLGQRSAEVHLRFHHRRSLPLLAIARLVGASWHESRDGHSIGFHDFRGHPHLGRAYARLLASDMAAVVRSRVLKPQLDGTTVVMDRFIVDTMVDLSLKLGDEAFADGPGAQRFWRLEPAGIRRILLDPGPADLRGRRRDLALDPQRDERIARYRALAARRGFAVVDCTKEIPEVARSIRAALAVPEVGA